MYTRSTLAALKQTFIGKCLRARTVNYLREGRARNLQVFALGVRLLSDKLLHALPKVEMGARSMFCSTNLRLCKWAASPKSKHL